MIRYYKTIDNKLEKLNSFEEGCWINLVEPNQSEINEIANLLNIDIDSIKSALDEEERSRIDVEDNHTLILIDIPVLKSFTLIRKLDSYFKFCIKMQLIIYTT